MWHDRPGRQPLKCDMIGRGDNPWNVMDRKLHKLCCCRRLYTFLSHVILSARCCHPSPPSPVISPGTLLVTQGTEWTFNPTCILVPTLMFGLCSTKITSMPVHITPFFRTYSSEFSSVFILVSPIIVVPFHLPLPSCFCLHGTEVKIYKKDPVTVLNWSYVQSV